MNAGPLFQTPAGRSTAQPRGCHPVLQTIPGLFVSGKEIPPCSLPRPHPPGASPLPNTPHLRQWEPPTRRCRACMADVVRSGMGRTARHFIRHYWGNRRCFSFLRRLICLSWAGASGHHQVVPHVHRRRARRTVTAVAPISATGLRSATESSRSFRSRPRPFLRRCPRIGVPHTTGGTNTASRGRLGGRPVGPPTGWGTVRSGPGALEGAGTANPLICTGDHAPLPSPLPTPLPHYREGGGGDGQGSERHRAHVWHWDGSRSHKPHIPQAVPGGSAWAPTLAGLTRTLRCTRRGDRAWARARRPFCEPRAGDAR